MRHEIDRFAHLDSFVHRWDPRWKLTSGILFILAYAVVRQDIRAAGLGLAVVGFLLTLSRLPPLWVVARLRWVLVFLCFFAVVVPLTGPAPWWSFAGLLVSRPGLHLAGVLILKVLTLVVLVIILFATAPVQETMAALQQLRVPAVLVQLVHFTYRYIFVIADELARMGQALAARGFSRRWSRHTIAVYGQLAGNLVVRSVERAERVEMALIARGYDGTFRTTRGFATRASDVLKCIGLVSAAAVLAALEWLGR